MNKKAYLWNLLPILISIMHIGEHLPEPFNEMTFNMFIGFRYLFYVASGAYYCFINYSFFRSNLRKAFLFSLLGLSLWWGIDTVLYFAVGYVDNIGIFLMKCMVAYNYIIFAISWGIVYIIARHKAKKAQRGAETVE